MKVIYLRFFLLLTFNFFIIFTHAVLCQEEPFDKTLKSMQRKFQTLTDYHCIYKYYTARDEKSYDITFSYFFKKPKMIRMEIMAGIYPGTIMLYNPEAVRDKVRVQVGNPALAVLQKIFFGEYFELHRMVDLRGKGVHESDWGTFIGNHLKLLHLVKSKFMGEEKVNGKTTLFYRLTSDNPAKTMSIKIEDVWIDKRTYFPVKYIHYDTLGQVIRRSVYNDLEFNAGLHGDIFKKFRTDSR